MTTQDSRASDAPGKTALVTGAAGFIGSHVAERLVAGGHRVIGVDDLSGGFLVNVTEGAEFRRGSVEDARFVESLWQEESNLPPSWAMLTETQATEGGRTETDPPAVSD